jgi:hypothetical protein
MRGATRSSGGPGDRHLEQVAQAAGAAQRARPEVRASAAWGRSPRLHARRNALERRSGWIATWGRSSRLHARCNARERTSGRSPPGDGRPGCMRGATRASGRPGDRHPACDRHSVRTLGEPAGPADSTHSSRTSLAAPSPSSRARGVVRRILWIEISEGCVASDDAMPSAKLVAAPGISAVVAKGSRMIYSIEYAAGGSRS